MEDANFVNLLALHAKVPKIIVKRVLKVLNTLMEFVFQLAHLDIPLKMVIVFLAMMLTVLNAM
jgi:hypothetical protein